MGHSGEVWVEASRGGLQALTQFKTKVSLPFLRQETIFDDPHSFGFALMGKKLCYKQTSHSSVLKIVKPCAVRLVLDRVGGGRGFITKFSIRGGSAPFINKWYPFHIPSLDNFRRQIEFCKADRTR